MKLNLVIVKPYYEKTVKYAEIFIYSNYFYLFLLSYRRTFDNSINK
jgi:hypothetical protein